LSEAQKRLAIFGSRAKIVHASYTTLAYQLAELGWSAVNGIIIDLGVSSMQLDTPERGFSFRFDAPLDMRFNPENLESAADILNKLPEKDLADLIYKFGEEKKSRQIAKVIVSSRPIMTTRQLAEIVLRAIGGKHSTTSKSRLHPATRTFQALRIAVNNELDALEEFLPQAVKVLTPGGRLAVISYHSLEDRIVKQFFRLESRGCICPPKQPQCTCNHKAQVKELTRRPIKAAAQEIESNPRSRSARLRVVEKLEN
jgi:16S rRNA (cytosine1402-N4)-methyltransferase